MQSYQSIVSIILSSLDRSLSLWPAFAVALYPVAPTHKNTIQCLSHYEFLLLCMHVHAYVIYLQIYICNMPLDIYL